MPDNYQQNEASASFHPNDETLGFFLHNALDNGTQASVKSHLQACPACFRRMARLQKAFNERDSIRFERTPENFVEKARQLMPTPATLVEEAKQLAAPRSARHQPSLLDFVEQLKSWVAPIPGWGYGLAGATAVAVILFLLLPAEPVENFSLDEQLVITTLGPMGFAGEREVVAYSGMSVRLSEDGEQLVFSWPAIAHAEFYEVTLILDEEKRRITPLGGIADTSCALPKLELQAGVRYQWELSGRMKDRRVFAAKAGFVMKR